MVHGWMRSFKKTYINEKEKRSGIQQPFNGTWVADFMMRQDGGKFMLGKYLSDKKLPWKRWRRLGMAMAGNTQLHYLGTPLRCTPTTYRLELLIFGRGCVVVITKFFFQQQQYIYTDNAYI